MTVKIKVDTRKFDHDMSKYRRKLSKSKPVLTKVADGEIKAAQTRIRTSKTDPSGNRWAPWSYATIAQRNRMGTTSRGLLYNTGFLLRSFFKRVTNTKAEVRNTAPYASYLQEGTNRMPARRFLGISNGSRKRIKTLFRKFLRLK